MHNLDFTHKQTNKQKSTIKHFLGENHWFLEQTNKPMVIYSLEKPEKHHKRVSDIRKHITIT